MKCELSIGRTWKRADADGITPRYRIALARPADLGALPAIEIAAARLLAGHAPDSVLSGTTDPETFAQAQRDGHLWVALADDVPIGFAHVRTAIERDAVHLEELDVHPAHGRRGLGTLLVLRVCRWAVLNGYESVTLTTFRDPAWNMPFYARLGFDAVPHDQLGSALSAVVEDEGSRGLDPSRRVVMRRRFRWWSRTRGWPTS
jgi:GNAT superfamily N-acetyltransferase